MFLRENCPSWRGEKGWPRLGSRLLGPLTATTGFPTGVRGLLELDEIVLHAERRSPWSECRRSPFLMVFSNGNSEEGKG